MPLHDWTKVNSGLFHHFHQGWCWEISGALNRGPLPEGYSALVEQRSGSREADVLAIEEDDPPPVSSKAGVVALREKQRARIVRQSEREYYADKASRVVIRHQSRWPDDRLGRVVAFIEIVSPGNKHDEVSLHNFCDNVVAAIRARVHLLVVDLFPPTPRDPVGIDRDSVAIHTAIWDHFEPDDPFEPLSRQNRVLASYEADGVNTAYIETPTVGDPLPAMPLFIAPEAHILVPLEDTYLRAWSDTPQSVRRLVE
jgi:hypothetical protein